MIGFYDYTMWATYLGLTSSVIGLWFALSGYPLYAVFCLMFSGFCDMFDGKIARTKKDRSEMQKKYGIQLDSLSDLVCFGVLPAVIGYVSGCREILFVPFLVLYILNAMIRLAYFNVTEEERQKETGEVRKTYMGVPVTTAALVFPFVYCFRDLLGDHFRFLYASMLLIVAVGFVFPVKIRKPGIRGMIVMTVLGLLMFAGLIVIALQMN